MEQPEEGPSIAGPLAQIVPINSLRILEASSVQEHRAEGLTHRIGDLSPLAKRFADSLSAIDCNVRCFRCLLLVICTHPLAGKPLMSNLTHTVSGRRYSDCN